MHWTRFNYSFSFRSNLQYGVPQSSVLDGLFITINMIDLFYEYVDGKITKHANDTILYYCVTQKEPPEVIEQGVLKGFTKFTGNTCARSPALSKKRFWHRCFPVNFVKFLRTPFSQNTSGRLLIVVIDTPNMTSKNYRPPQQNVFFIILLIIT